MFSSYRAWIPHNQRPRPNEVAKRNQGPPYIMQKKHMQNANNHTTESQSIRPQEGGLRYFDASSFYMHYLSAQQQIRQSFAAFEARHRERSKEVITPVLRPTGHEQRRDKKTRVKQYRQREERKKKKKKAYFPSSLVSVVLYIA